MFLVYGMMLGYDDPNDRAGKSQQYRIVQEMESCY
jgi:hypothetical protein